MSTFLDQNRKIFPFSTLFEDASRFTTALSTGTASFGTLGLECNAGGIIPGYVKVVAYAQSTNYKSFKGQPIWLGSVAIKTADKNHTYYWGFGEITVVSSIAGHTYTDAHIGFKALIDGAGIITLYATQANGAAETAISLGTIVASDVLDLYIKVDRLGVNYSFRKNAGDESDPVRIEKTLPVSDNQSFMQMSVSTNGQSTVADFIASFAAYGR